MVFYQLVGAGVEFGMAQLVQWKLGFTGLVLMTMVLMGMRAGHPRLAGWAVFVLFLLTLQLLA